MLKKLTVWLIVLVGWVASASQVNVITCSLDSTEIQKVYCQVGFATVFELPEGKRIRDFVIGDPSAWKAETNGLFGFVSPRGVGFQTSLSIITEENELVVFQLLEKSLDKTQPVSARVRVVANSNMFQFFAPKNSEQKEEAAEKNEHEGGRPVPDKFKRKYKVHGKNFLVSLSGEDGIFTYIILGKSQDRPALFFVNEREDSSKRILEPVKYVDKGDYYLVHRRLASRREKFVLKLGKIENEITFK